MKRAFVLIPIILTLFTAWFITTPPPAQAQTGSKVLELIGQFGGKVTAVAVQGQYAYAGVGTSIVIFDITDPARPTQVGQSAPFPNFVENIYVNGTMVYVADGAGGLYILDVSNPAAPTTVSHYTDETTSYWVVYDVQTVGNYLYLASYSGLQIVSISNPAKPSLVGSYNLGQVGDVYVVGNYAYLALSYNNIQIIDINNPTAPSLVGSYNIIGNDIFVANNIAYVADSEGLKLIDVSNPAKPTFVGEYRTGAATSVYVKAGYAYLTTNSSGNQGTLWVIDVSNSTKPGFVGNYMTGGNPTNIYVANNIAHVITKYNGWQTINVSNPTEPSLLGNYIGINIYKIYIIDNIVYIMGNDVNIIDTSDLTKPKWVGSYTTTGHVNDVVGNLAYVTNNSGLSIYDISNLLTPTLIGSYPCYYPADVKVIGNYAYIATPNSLIILDISNPASPSLVSSHSEGGGQRIQIVNNYAYVVNGGGGLLFPGYLKILNVANPISPSLVGIYNNSLTGGSFSTGFSVKGNYVYVADISYGLKVINVSNPAAPRLASVYSTGGTATDVQVIGNLAYLSNYYGNSGKLVVLDISNPGAPTFVSSYDTPGNANSVHVTNNTAYVADGDGGLAVLRLKDPIPLDSITISGPAKGSLYDYSSFTATISPASATKPIKYTWSPTPYNGQGTAKPTYYWSGLGMQTITVTASNMNSVVTGTYTVTIKNIVPTALLTVNKTGNGTITSYPAGIDCGNDCSENYALNTFVTLTAIPESGFRFTGWSGACAGTSSCQVNMYQAQYITANFEPVTAVKSVTISGPTASIIGNYDSFIATISPYTATLPITYIWSPIPSYGQGTSQAIYTWLSEEVQIITVTASNINGVAMDSHSLNINPSITMTLQPTFSGPNNLPYPTFGDTITYTYILTNQSSHLYGISSVVDSSLGTIVPVFPAELIPPFGTVTHTLSRSVTTLDTNLYHGTPVHTVSLVGTFNTIPDAFPFSTIITADVGIRIPYSSSTTPTFALSYQADKTKVQVGDTITYTLVVTGTDLTQVVRLTNTLPTGLELVPNSLSSGLNYDVASRQLRYSGMVNGNLTLTYRATVAPDMGVGSILYSAVEATTEINGLTHWRGAGTTVVIPNLTFKETMVVVHVGVDNNLNNAGTQAMIRLRQACQQNPMVKCLVLIDWRGEDNAYLYNLSDAPIVTSNTCPNAFNLTCNGAYQSGQNLWKWGEYSASTFSVAELLIATTWAYPNAKNVDQLIFSLIGHGGGWSNQTLLAGQPQKHEPQPQKHDPQPQGVLYEENPLSVMSLQDLRYALTLAQRETGHNVGLLYLDMCLMSSLEALHELTGLADYVLASPNWTFAAFPYDKHIQAIDGQKDSRAIGQAWLTHQANQLRYDQYPYTFSLIDMAKLPQLVTATEQLAQALLPHSQTLAGRAKIRQARLESECFDNNQNQVIETADSACDLGSFALKLQAQFQDDYQVQVASQAILEQLTQTIISEQHNTQKLHPLYPWAWSTDVKGISLFTPLITPTWQLTSYNKYELKFAEETSWDTVLTNYWQNTVIPELPATCSSAACFPLVLERNSTITLVMPELFASPQTTVTVPINVLNMPPDSCLEAVNIAVSYDATLATFVKAKAAAALTGVALTVNSSQPGWVKLAGTVTNCQPFAGSGTLFNLTFQVNGAVSQTSRLDFLTGITQTALYDRRDLLNPLTVIFRNGSLTLANAFMRGDVNGDGAVNTADAALVLRYVLGKTTLDYSALNACNVNGDSRCSEADATLIRCYAAYQDWATCQQPRLASARQLEATAANTTTVSLWPITRVGTQTLFLKVENGSDVAGGYFTLNYNPHLMSLKAISKTDLTEAFILDSHEAVKGELRLALANDAPTGMDGALLTLQVYVDSPTATITLGEVRLNNHLGQDFATRLQRPLTSTLTTYYLPIIGKWN